MAREDETGVLLEYHKNIDKLKFEFGFQWFAEDKVQGMPLRKMAMLGFLDRDFAKNRRTIIYKVKDFFKQ